MACPLLASVNGRNAGGAQILDLNRIDPSVGPCLPLHLLFPQQTLVLCDLANVSSGYFSIL
jgi:hypothetical protein